MPKSTFIKTGIVLTAEQYNATKHLPPPIKLSGLTRTLVRLYLEGKLPEWVEETVIEDALKTNNAQKAARFDSKSGAEANKLSIESRKQKCQTPLTNHLKLSLQPGIQSQP
jgi:hypothetical protein